MTVDVHMHMLSRYQCTVDESLHHLASRAELLQHLASLLCSCSEYVQSLRHYVRMCMQACMLVFLTMLQLDVPGLCGT